MPTILNMKNSFQQSKKKSISRSFKNINIDQFITNRRREQSVVGLSSNISLNVLTGRKANAYKSGSVPQKIAEAQQVAYQSAGATIEAIDLTNRDEL